MFFPQKVSPIWRRAFFFSLTFTWIEPFWHSIWAVWDHKTHHWFFRSKPTTTVFDLIYILPCWIQLNPITERSPAQMHSNWNRSGSTGFDFEPPKNLLEAESLVVDKIRWKCFAIVAKHLAWNSHRRKTSSLSLWFIRNVVKLSAESSYSFIIFLDNFSHSSQHDSNQISK